MLPEDATFLRYYSLAGLYERLREDAALFPEDAVGGHQPQELLAGILAAAVRMMQQRIRFAASPDRHHQGIGDKLRCHRCAHRPSHDTAREEIDDGCDIEPAFRCGEVSDPLRFAAGASKLRSSTLGAT